MYVSLFATSNISGDSLLEAVNAVLTYSKDKKRKFVESVELQVGLKNYDLAKDKRFSGTIRYILYACAVHVAPLAGRIHYIPGTLAH